MEVEFSGDAKQMVESNKKVTGFTIKQIDTDRGIDFSIEGIGQITNGKFVVLCITALLSVLDEYSDDEKDFILNGINKSLSSYSFNEFTKMYCFADELGLLKNFDKNDNDTIKN